MGVSTKNVATRHGMKYWMEHYACGYDGITCKAEELSAITLAASRNALEAFCSPSAAIT